MIVEKQAAINEIDRKVDDIIAVSDKIWEFAELSLQEDQSAKVFVEALKKEGFDVEEGNNGIRTAFKAKFGSGRPYIGILAEYDALDGLSQKAGSAVKEELVKGGSGHGCGHNLLGAGSFAAALGIKKAMEEFKLPGTVILYGCPGEEGGAAKAFMARDKEFYNIDAALTWHPGDCNEVSVGSTNSCIQTQYMFYGQASHASGAPQLGRSALDAVELMNIGVQFLREHMDDRARIHYAITDTGGVSPNVVQAYASVLYMVRSNYVKDAIELQKRVDKIAMGAAMMTETTMEKMFIDGLSDTVSNNVLEQLLFDNFEEIGVPTYTEEEHALADAISKTYLGSDALPGIGTEFKDPASVKAAKKGRESGHAMNDYLLPLYKGDAFRAGSTDVGDVSYETPTAQIYVAAWPNGCPGHSWQNVSCGGSSIGHKSVITAGKVLAASVIDLMKNPDILAKAREEFEIRTADGFISPIPKDAVPVIPKL